MKPLPFLLQPGADLPSRGHHDDAGLDLYCVEAVKIPPGEFVDVDCGCCVQLPPGVWALLVGRSSTLRKRRLLVSLGVIDTGYRGGLLAGVWNLGEAEAAIEVGDRLAQLILVPNLTTGYEPVSVRELESSERGVAGFGSTGI